MTTHKIAITGSTGVVGRRTVRDLLAAGHDVTAITRSERGAAALQRLGATPVIADVFEPAELRAAFHGADAVVNLLTNIPPAARMAEPGAWAGNDRLRREASGAVAAAARAAGARRLVQESVVYLYADGGDEWLDEHAPLAASPATASAAAAERNAAGLFDGTVVLLRFGQFIGPDSDLTLAELEQARRGVPLPGGTARVPTLWLDDASAAVLAALHVPAGTYNVADDEPPTRQEVSAAIAAAVGRPHLQLATDGGVPDPMGRSLRLSNRRLRAASGWAPRVRGGIDGWALIAAEQAAA